MARALRIEFPGACYHVLNRGNQGQPVFHGEADYELFLARLDEFADQFQVQVRSYCLMPNHYHLYLRTVDAGLSRFMQSFLTSFTVTMNRRHETGGHLFQGRFKALLVEEETYHSRVSRYIHMNPIRVRAVAGRAAADLRQEVRRFRWSSYANIIGLRKCPSWLDREAVLGNWGSNLRERQKNYAKYVESGILRDIDDQLAAIAVCGILGSDDFIDRMRRSLASAGEAADRRERGQEAALRASVKLDDVIAAVAAATGEPEASLLRRYNRGSTGRQVLLYLAGRHCRGGCSLAALAKRLGPISLGALTRARERMVTRLEVDRAVSRLVAKIERALGIG